MEPLYRRACRGLLTILCVFLIAGCRSSSDKPTGSDKATSEDNAPKQDAPDTRQSRSGWVTGLEFSGDGRHLIIADGRVQEWDARDGQSLSDVAPLAPGNRMWMTTPDRKQIVAATRQGEVEVLNLSDGASTEVGNFENIECLSVNAKGTRLAIAGPNYLEVRNLATDAVVYKRAVTKGVLALGLFDKDTDSVLVVLEDGSVLGISEDGNKVAAVAAEASVSTAGTYTSRKAKLMPDGNGFAINKNGKVQIWRRLDNAAKKLSVIAFMPGLERDSGFQYENVEDMAISPDGEYLAIATTFKTTTSKVVASPIYIWSVKERKIKRQIVLEAATFCLSFSPDSKMLAVGGGTGSYDDSQQNFGALCVFDWPKGKIMWQFAGKQK